MAEQKKKNEKADKETKDVAVREEAGALVEIDYAEAEAGGFEDVTAKDFKIPILRVLQSTSPECDDDDPRYIKGAKAGSLYNISTKEVFDGKTGVKLVPCKFFRRWVEWVPRDSGGGYVDEYDIKDPIHLTGTKKEKGTALDLPNGNDLVETGYFPCIRIKEDGSLEEVVITISSSGFNFSKSWLSTIRGRTMIHPKIGKPFTPAFWSHIYLIGSETKKNQQHSWKGFCVLGFELLKDKSIYETAAEFNRQMNMTMIRFGGDREQSSNANSSSSNAAEETAF